MKIKIGRDRYIFLSYFTGVIFTGALLLSLPIAWKGPLPLRFIDALFTSTSAVCVTGLITVDTALYTRFGQIVIMLLIQAGGLGLIAFATIYVALPRRRISLLQKGFIGDYSISEVEYRPKDIIRTILAITFGIEILGMLLLNLSFAPRGLTLFDSAFHAVSAFCNAGFSTRTTSLEEFVSDPIVNFAMIGLIISGGLGFVVVSDLAMRARGKRLHLSYHSMVVIRTTTVLIAAGTIVYLMLEWDGAFAGLAYGQKAMAALFASVTPRTAGFDTINPAAFQSGSSIVTMILMFIGASPASTGGGIKTTTFFILLMTAFRYHDGTHELHFHRRAIHPATVYKAVGVVVKALLVVFATVLAMEAFEKGRVSPLPPLHIAFEAISAFATVGLSLGITPTLSDPSKATIILAMFVGRVGLFAMALPRAGRKIEGYAALPSGDVMVG